MLMLYVMERFKSYYFSEYVQRSWMRLWSENLGLTFTLKTGVCGFTGSVLSGGYFYLQAFSTSKILLLVAFAKVLFHSVEWISSYEKGTEKRIQGASAHLILV